MGHNKDYIETIRKLVIRAIGLTGHVTQEQYVATLQTDVEHFEITLHDNGVIRNSLAYFKHDPDGEWSVGSWVYLPTGYFGHFQEHLTIFTDGDLFVHEEWNWRRHPIKHLEESHFEYPTCVWRSRLDSWGVTYEIK